MELVTPGYGLIVWTLVFAVAVVVFVGLLYNYVKRGVKKSSNKSARVSTEKTSRYRK